MLWAALTRDTAGHVQQETGHWLSE